MPIPTYTKTTGIFQDILAGTTKEQGGSMPSAYVDSQSDVREVIAKLRTLHRQGVDVTDAYKAIEALKEKDDEQSRIQRTLQGTAETALMGQPANLFVLAYRREGLTRSAYGFVRRNGHVTIELGHGWPISSSAESILELQERIAKSGMAYAIAYATPPKDAEDAEKPDLFDVLLEHSANGRYH